MIKDEIPRNEMDKNLQDLHEKFKILLNNTKKTWTKVEAHHVMDRKKML